MIASLIPPSIILSHETWTMSVFTSSSTSRTIKFSDHSTKSTSQFPHTSLLTTVCSEPNIDLDAKATLHRQLSGPTSEGAVRSSFLCPVAVKPSSVTLVKPSIDHRYTEAGERTYRAPSPYPYARATSKTTKTFWSGSSDGSNEGDMLCQRCHEDHYDTTVPKGERLFR